jgi:regulator of RNase E activity RraA
MSSSSMPERNGNLGGRLSYGGLEKNRGIAGMIVDGAGRDIDELRDIG